GLAVMSQATEASIKAHESNDIIGYMEANDLFRTTWISQVPNRHLASMITRLADHVEAVRLATLRNPTFREWSLTSTRKITEAFMSKEVVGQQKSVRFILRKAVAAFYATHGSLIGQQNTSAFGAEPAIGRRLFVDAPVYLLHKAQEGTQLAARQPFQGVVDNGPGF